MGSKVPNVPVVVTQGLSEGVTLLQDLMEGRACQVGEFACAKSHHRREEELRSFARAWRLGVGGRGECAERSGDVAVPRRPW